MVRVATNERRHVVCDIRYNQVYGSEQGAYRPASTQSQHPLLQRDPLKWGLIMLPIFYFVCIFINLVSIFYDAPSCKLAVAVK
jgi:hypothetical protein